MSEPGKPAELYGMPWPEGDAPALARAAQSTRTAAASLGSAESSLATSASGPTGWKGSAADAFQHAVVTEREGMRKSATALDEASTALRELSHHVRSAQKRVRELAAEVQDAESAATIAASKAWWASLVAVGVDAEADADAAHARSSAAEARTHAADVRSHAIRRAEHVCERLHSADKATARAVGAAVTLAPMGGRGHVLAPTPAHGFGATVFRDLRQSDLQQLAYFFAGIETWDVDAGLVANDRTIQKAWTYYGQLWSGDHDLQWAGMANLVGPLFYAGWQDLHAVRKGANHLPRQLSPLSLMADSELDWFQHRFLSMQKQIFDDLAWKHAAYSLGGIELMRDLNANGELRPSDLKLFEGIASGVPEQVAHANKEMLRREQRDIIQNDYKAIKDHHGPVGGAFTLALSYTAENPIPGGDSYFEDFHHTKRIPLLRVPIGVEVPTGNVANFDDRWRWIDEDMLPKYRDALRNPEVLQQLIDRSIADRAEDMRLLPGSYP